MAAAIGLVLTGFGSTVQAAGSGRPDDPRLQAFHPGEVRLGAARSARPSGLAPSPGSVILVSTLDDSGPGSLRFAIDAANGSPFTHDELRFDPALAGGTINLSTGTLLITSPMTIRNPSMLRVGITSDAGRPAPSGGLPTTNVGRLLMVDDGDDDLNSRVSFEGLEMFGATVVTEAGAPGPSGGAAIIDEADAVGPAILSAESIEIRRSVVRDNMAMSVTGGFAMSAVLAQGELIIEDSIISGNLAMSAAPMPDSYNTAVGPLFAVPDDAADGVARAALLRLDHSLIEGNRVYAINSSTGSGSPAAFPSTVTDGMLQMQSSTIRTGRLVAGGRDATISPLTASTSPGGALMAAFSVLDVRDSLVSDNTTTLDGLTAFAYSSAVSVTGGASMSITRSEISGNAAYLQAMGSGLGVRATLLGTALMCAADVCNLSESTIAENFGQVDGITDVDGTGADASGRSDAHVLGTTTLFGASNVVNSTISGNRTLARSLARGATADAFNLSLEATAVTQGGGLALAPPESVADGVVSRGPIRHSVIHSTIADNRIESQTAIEISGSSSGVISPYEISHASGGGFSAVNGTDLSLLTASVLINNQATATASNGLSTSNGNDAMGNFITPGFNLVSDPTGNNIVDGDAGNIVGTIPLEPLKHNGGPTRTHALTPGSVAIDSAAPFFGLSNDQRGYGPRSTGGAPDRGAYECGATPLPGGDDNDLFLDDFDLSC